MPSPPQIALLAFRILLFLYIRQHSPFLFIRRRKIMQFLETIRILVTAISALAALGVWIYLKIQAAQNPTKDVQAELDEIRTVEEHIQTALFAVVTDLERTYGSGTGELKLAAGVQKVLQLLPESLQKYITTDTIVDWIENALAAAKLKWAKNSTLLGGNDSYVN
jgi:hypothetical protein